MIQGRAALRTYLTSFDQLFCEDLLIFDVITYLSLSSSHVFLIRTDEE